MKVCGLTAKLGLVKTSCTVPAETGAAQLSVTTLCAAVSPAGITMLYVWLTCGPLLSLRIQ